ncbi:hypothetical protein C0J52_22596 [Blattella germanica]|nr:hypothetical protein C0J52_22596 [Blattella germanica]
MLKGSNYKLDNDYDFNTRQIRKKLLPFMHEARDNGHRANIINDKLKINGKIYDLDQLENVFTNAENFEHINNRKHTGRNRSNSPTPIYNESPNWLLRRRRFSSSERGRQEEEIEQLNYKIPRSPTIRSSTDERLENSRKSRSEERRTRVTKKPHFSNEIDMSASAVEFRPSIRRQSKSPEGRNQDVDGTAITRLRSEMADTSLYSVEERLVVSVWAHERPHTGKTMEDVRQDFTRRFHKNAPPKMTILRWEKKLFLLGCIKDKPRPGAPVKRQNTCAGVDVKLWGFLKYVPLSIVLTNTLSSLLIGFSITYRTGKPPLINPNSWLAAEDAEIQGKKQPFEIHIRALVAMGGCSTSIGTGMIVAHSAVEMTFIMLAIISGMKAALCIKRRSFSTSGTRATDSPPLSWYRTGTQGKPLQSDAREMVINVHKFCTEEYDALKVGKPTISVADITGRTDAATGVSRRTVYRILDEKKKSDVAGCVLSTPGEKRTSRTPTKTVVDSFSASAIRRTVYSLYRTHFLPSLNDIKEALKEADLFHGSK